MKKIKVWLIHRLGGFVMTDMSYETKDAWHRQLFKVWRRYDEGRMERRILEYVLEGKMPPGRELEHDD